MSLRRPVLLSLSIAALVVAALPGCSTGGDDRLLVYSGRDKELIGPLLTRFAEETGAVDTSDSRETWRRLLRTAVDRLRHGFAD